jgi:hypothetical protein
MGMLMHRTLSEEPQKPRAEKPAEVPVETREPETAERKTAGRRKTK